MFCLTQILHSYVWSDLFHPAGVFLCVMNNLHLVGRASFSQVHQNQAREWENLLGGWMCLLQLPRFAANRLHSLQLCLISFLSLWWVLVTKDELNCNAGYFFQKLFVEILKMHLTILPIADPVSFSKWWLLSKPVTIFVWNNKSIKRYSYICIPWGGLLK